MVTATDTTAQPENAMTPEDVMALLEQYAYSGPCDYYTFAEMVVKRAYGLEEDE